MKTEELMIGDWVMTEAGGEIYPVQIKCLPGILDRFEVTPIKITPEILEKIGFKSVWMIKDFAWEFDDYFISYDMGCNSLFVCKGDEWILDVSDITYVHELQHALRLCKIDKEIIL